MSKFLACLVALIVLIAAIVLLAPNLIPAETYKGRIETAASNAIGRNVTIGDELSFKIFPQTAFSVENLVIADKPEFGEEPFARIGKADIGVKLFSLLSDKIEIQKFVLTDAEIKLQKLADGRTNWVFTDGGGDGDAQSAPQSTQDLSLGDVRIIGGRLRYDDKSAQQTYLAENIDAKMRLTSLSQPLEFDGNLDFQGAPSTVNAVLSNPADLSEKRPANFKINATVGDSTLGADLTLTPSETATTFNGPVNFDAPDLPAFASLFGFELESAPGFDRLKFSGGLDGASTQARLESAKIEFDKIDGEGDLTFDWSGARPKTTGAIAVGALDFRPYMPAPVQSTEGFPEWSEAPLNFTSLRNMDADLEIRADKIFINDIETTDSRLRLAINAGKMTADISQLGLYGGGGSGRLVVDASRAVPSIAGNFTLASVDAEPFSVAVLKNDKLLGLGSFNIQFTAAGASQAAIMSSLDGKGGFDVNDGAVKGVNFVKLASAVNTLYNGGAVNPAAISSAIAEARRPDEKTDFSKMLSQFTIDNGLIDAPTINLEGPFLTMTGVGKINLPGQAVDLRLLPKASTAADNQSGRIIAIPVRVSGTFSNPVIGIDVESLMRGKVESTFRDLLNNAFKSDDEAGGKATAEEGADQPADPAKSILKGLIGGEKSSDGTTGESSSSTAEDDAAQEAVSGAINQLFGAGFGGAKQKKSEESDGAQDESAPN